MTFIVTAVILRHGKVFLASHDYFKNSYYWYKSMKFSCSYSGIV